MASADKWRAIRLENEESVRYLNRMFARGWYLMELGVDGLEYLNFTVPLKPVPIEYDKKKQQAFMIDYNYPPESVEAAIVQKMESMGYKAKEEKGKKLSFS